MVALCVPGCASTDKDGNPIPGTQYRRKFTVGYGKAVVGVEWEPVSRYVRPQK